MYVGRRSAPPVEYVEYVAHVDSRGTRGIGVNVVFLGLTSLFTDIGSEMVNAILPLYLTFELRMSPLAFGIVDGLYQGIVALLRLAGALVADRWRRFKEVAGAGYAVSAACKLGLLATGGVWLPTTAVLLVDRAGKGIRTAPRDALISLSASPRHLGMAFGVHRAFDTTGAMLGPFLAFVLLARVPEAYDALFVTSFCAAIIGLAILVFFVDNHPADARAPGAQSGVDVRAVARLALEPGVRGVLVAGVALSFATIGDSFVYLVLRDRVDLQVGYFPLLYVGTSLVYLVLAVPLGHLADRAGRATVFLVGHLALGAVYGLLLAPSLGPTSVLVALLLYGVYYAATDGVLIALTSSFLAESVRASGIALVTTVTAIARLAAAVGFGALWTLLGSQVAIVCFGIGLFGALVVGSIALRPSVRGEHVDAILE